MNEKFKLTIEKVEQLKEEKRQLLIEREKNVEAIKEARSQGDLSENADYDAARNEQARIASRLLEVDNILKNYELIDESLDTSDDVVVLGKWIKVMFEGLEDEEEPVQIYKIVGTLEADPLMKLISNESPLGAAIINHTKGDKVYVKPEEGDEFYVTILDINSKGFK